VPNYFKKDWLNDWKTERNMGKTRYVLTHGILFLVIAALIDAFVNDKVIWAMPAPKAIQNILIYLAGGLGYGLFTWWFNERKLKGQAPNK
jgi:hypothetical protein